MAEWAVTLSHGHEPVPLDTLAAAYAQAGRFADATKTAQKALGLARATAESSAGKIDQGQDRPLPVAHSVSGDDVRRACSSRPFRTREESLAGIIHAPYQPEAERGLQKGLPSLALGLVSRIVRPFPPEP